MPPKARSAIGLKTEEETIEEARKYINSARPVNDHGDHGTIFRVPYHIRQLDRKAYDPVVVSIGPFHHTDPLPTDSEKKKQPPHWRFVEDHKWWCVRHLLSRADQLLDTCLLELKKQDVEVRRCYSEDFPELNVTKMAFIMLLDGCFIIHLMLKMGKGMKGEDLVGKEDEGKKRREFTIERREGEVALNIEEEENWSDDLTVAGLFTSDIVVHDLLKCENQIPFFVIEILFDMLKTPIDQGIDLPKRALQLFGEIQPNESKLFQKSPMGRIHHLLQLFHSSRISRGQSEGKIAVPKRMWIPSATELAKAGVNFRENEFPETLLDIKFKDGQMQIPRLKVYDDTGALFRNLIAFEQCFAEAMNHFTIYALFMDCIIEKPKDARLLQFRGILDNLSTENALAGLFTKLCKKISFSSSDGNNIADMFVKVNEYYSSKYATLRRNYFSNPWAIVSVIPAFFLLLLTVEQAVFAGLSYFRPPQGL